MGSKVYKDVALHILKIRFSKNRLRCLHDSVVNLKLTVTKSPIFILEYTLKVVQLSLKIDKVPALRPVLNALPQI